MGEETQSIFLPVRVTSEAIAEDGWDEVMQRINTHTLEPLQRADVFTFSGHCSNDGMDAYYTRMDPATTLKNYVADLRGGTPLQDSHNIFQAPYGRSYDGQLEIANEIENAVRGNWYLIRDLQMNGANTNDFIRAINAGIIKDMSVGFGGNELWYRCSSCGRDVMSWECPHIPSLEDENGKATFSWVVNGRLREVSTVYKGATPGAYIDKARAFVDQGQISLENVARLELTYQVRLDNGKRSFFMPKKKEVNDLNILEQLRAALQESKIEKKSVYDLLSGEGEVFRQPDDIALRNELGDAASVEGIQQLKTEAGMGRTYVSDLIDQAVAARTRAQGEKFNAESYKNMLVRSGDVDFLKSEIDSYEEMVKERFIPGRQTEIDLPSEKQEQEAARSAKNENIFD